MTVEQIGAYAGQVWTALAEGGANSLKSIKKATKLKDKEVFAAIGWLSREGKLQLADAEDPKEINITLTEM